MVVPILNEKRKSSTDDEHRDGINEDQMETKSL